MLRAIAGACLATATATASAFALDVSYADFADVSGLKLNDRALADGRAVVFANEPVDGDVSFLTQSGAIGGSLLIGAWSQITATARSTS